VLFLDVPQQDRRALLIFGGFAVVLVTGLVVTGVWLLLFDAQPAPDDRFFVIEADDRTTAARSSLEDAHATFGELTALLSIFVVAWWSYRIRAEVSWPGVAAFVVLVSTVVTGAMIRIIAIVRDNTIVADVVGYWPIVASDFDYVAVGTRDLSPLSIQLWLFAHLLGLPLVIAILVAKQR